MDLDTTPPTDDAMVSPARSTTVRAPERPRSSASIVPPLRRAETDSPTQGANSAKRRAGRRTRMPTPPAQAPTPITLEMDGLRVSLEPHRLTIDFTTER